MIGGRGDDQFIHRRRVDGPGVVEDANLVGPVKDARVAIEVSVMRFIVVVVVVEQAEAEMVSIARDVVDDDRILALCLFVQSRINPVIARCAGVGAGYAFSRPIPLALSCAVRDDIVRVGRPVFGSTIWTGLL